MSPTKQLYDASAPDLLTSSIRELADIISPPESDADGDYAELRAFYRTEDGIVAFARDVIGIDLAPYQADILRMVVRHRRVAVRGPHGLGKTAIAAVVVLWSITVFDEDVKAPTTASVWRQLIFYLWPELKKWARRADWSKIGIQMREGKELLEQQIKLPRGREAFAVASNQPTALEGAHASKLAFVFDEAKAIPNDIWDAIEGAFSTGECYALAISTPGQPSGRFYEIHKRSAGLDDWAVRHVTIDEAIAAGRISREWVEQRKKQWGEKSAIYANRVLGEFDESGEDSVIPLAWIRAAIERGRACNWKGEGLISYGVDPAWKGEDKTAIARKVGRVIERVDSYAKQDTMQTAGRVAAAVDTKTPIAVDTIGVGAGVFDRLRELRYAVQAVNVSERAADHSGNPLRDRTGKLEFVNKRSWMWWLIRDALDPDADEPIALPDDDELVGDLTAPGWWYNSSGKIEVESKDDIRERIGRSPDKADAVALAIYAGRRRPMRIV